ncbi:Na+/H+ antiporter [Arcticibacter sp. MXS-1]|uniref:Na+/H+ antiporter n=1 Tax=Arcticibacter sp. MXS-1 TaxID=3341726 RepID=UPI0035A885A5
MKELWKWRRVISFFAFGLVILTSSVIAIVSTALIPGFSLALGFLLGGIISPPDAVSASSVLKTVNAPKRVLAITEGESLLNDASSLIVYRFALAAVVSGSAFHLHTAAWNFLWVIFMGVATGLIVGLVFYAILRWLPTTASTDTALILAAPHMMYLLAESMHFSGVLAVVTGGLFLSHQSHRVLSHISRIRGINVWSTISFILNGIVFMLIGLEMPLIVSQLGSTSLPEAISYALIITAVLMVSRVLFMLVTSAFTTFISHYITTADSHPGWKGPLVAGWAGMRGVVSLASALAIPLYLANGQIFPQRNLILFVTFVVILLTLVIQGLTLPYLIRFLDLKESEYDDYPLPVMQQETVLRTKTAKAALQLLRTTYFEHLGRNELLKASESRYQNELKFIGRLQKEAGPGQGASVEAVVVFKEVMIAVIDRQRNVLRELNRKAEFDEDLVKRQLEQLDLEEEKLRLQFDLTQN